MRGLFLAVVTGLLLTGCGKKGPLLYPDMLLPNSPAETAVSQTGSSVTLKFRLPESDRGGRRLADLAGVAISRQAGNGREELFRKFYLNRLPDNVQRYGNHIFVFDSDVEAGKSYSYRVTPFTGKEQEGSASPAVSVLLVQPSVPPVIRAESFPTEIKITFDPLPSGDSRFIGYNLYRSARPGAVPPLPVNREPLTGINYTDTELERNVTYLYSARTVEKQEAGGIVESPLSNVVEGMLKNDE